MSAENLIGNLPNKVGGEYQRPNPRDIESASNGSSPWKDETGNYKWDNTPVLPAGIYTTFDTSVTSPIDGAIYFGNGDSSSINSDWNASTIYDWARYSSDSSSWSAITPNEGQLCFDTSADVWYSFDSTTTGWNVLATPTATTPLTEKVIEIGDWNMDLDLGVDVAHGLSATEWKSVRSMDCIIRRDDDGAYLKLNLWDVATGGVAGSIVGIDSTNIELNRETSGVFDQAVYDSTGFNRGWITIKYTKD